MTANNRTTQQMRMYAARVEARKQRFSFLTLANLEKAFVIFALIMMQFTPPSPFPALPASAFRMVGVLFGALILFRYIPQMIGTLVSNLPFTALLLWCGAGILWSIAPDHSVEPVMLLYITSFFGIYIAMRYSLEEQLSIMMWYGLAIIIISFVMAYGFPEQGGLHIGGDHDGSWRAGFSHKNNYATLLTLSTLPMLLLGQRWGRWRWWLIIPIFWATWNSGSATGIVALLGMLSIIPLLHLMRLRKHWLIGALMIAVPFLVFIILGLLVNSTQILEALGRSTTLTGRTTIWNASMELFAERPLQGWGLWGAFSPASPIHDYLTWWPSHAHNSWVDTLLIGGAVGLVLFILALAIAFWQAILYAYRQNTWESLFPLVFMIHLNIVALTTESLLVRFDMAWIMFVGIVYGLAIAKKPLGRAQYRRPYSLVANQTE
jgi:O-antigen ligase